MRPAVRLIALGRGALRHLASGLWLPLSLAATLPACSSGDPPSAVKLNPNLHVLDAKISNDATVTDDALSFPVSDQAVLSRMPGDVISSGYGSSVIFLRRVVSVQSDGTQIVVATAPASLADAIQSGTLAYSVDDLAALGAPQVAPQDLGGLLGKQLDLTGLRLTKRSDVNSGKEAGGLEVNVTLADSHLDFRPRVGGNLQFDGARLIRASVIAETNVDELLTFDTKLDFTASVAKDFAAKTLAYVNPSQDKVDVLEIPVWSLTKPFWTWVGTFPVYQELTLGVKFGCYVGAKGRVEAIVGEAYRDHLRFGVEFDGNTWQGVGEHTSSFEPVFTPKGASGALYAKCYVQPRLDVKIFKVGGPFFLLNFYAKPQIQAGVENVDVNACTADGFIESTLDFGVEGQAGGKVDPFDAHIVDYELKAELFDLSIRPIDEKGTVAFDFSAICTPSSGSGSGGSGSGGAAGASGSNAGGASSAAGSSGAGGASGSGTAGAGPVATGVPNAACGAGDNNGPNNGTCGTDQRVYYCYQGVWHLKDDCAQKGVACLVEAAGVADKCAPPAPTPKCASDADCPLREACTSGSCVCPGPVCGALCCVAGGFCNASNKCCDGVHCSPGCPC